VCVTRRVVQHGYFLWQRQLGIAVDEIEQLADGVIRENQGTLTGAWRERQKTDLDILGAARRDVDRLSDGKERPQATW